ncbi:MAG: D-alanyl-D-alanine carboxypeptidase [Candidatus Omnitrophica bacterium]|nr:D-alanyl-D-alanine carboxypeptidase [Candidatus Omnitrophota bacterium]
MLLLTAAPSEAAKKKARGFYVSARGAVLMDVNSGKKLFSKNADTRVLPASTTKVMTALLVLEKLPLDGYVSVSQRSTGVQPSKINVRPGEQYKVRDLLFAILLNSANDASVVLAEAVAGSEWEFVKMMNRRARQLGAKNTKFANSNGLPSREAQYTSAYDMYLIFRAALKKPFFRDAVKIKYKTIYSRGGRKIYLKSHNKMLFKGWKKGVYGKTGYTRAARSCFVGYTQKGKRPLIIAVFGCTKRWDDIYRVLERYGGVDL